ncbi:MAG: hypothetical protein QM526_00205 [Alphaproteobacteria bacterium]|nr:hypothetical protein [Alphaproteobacteria bacterium]
MFFITTTRIRACVLVIIIASIFLLLYSSHGYAISVAGAVEDALSTILKGLILLIASMLNIILSIVLTFAEFTLRLVSLVINLNLSIVGFFINFGIFGIVANILKDIINLFIIGALIWLAIKNLFTEEAEASIGKKMLIIFATIIVVNFSGYIILFLVDASTYILQFSSYYYIDSSPREGFDPNLVNFVQHNLNIVRSLNTETINVDNALGIMFPFLGLTAVFFLMFIFFRVCMLLIIRFIYTLLIIMCAPLLGIQFINSAASGNAGIDYPFKTQIKAIVDEWWNQLIKVFLFIPIFLLGIGILGEIISDLIVQSGSSFSTKLDVKGVALARNQTQLAFILLMVIGYGIVLKKAVDFVDSKIEKTITKKTWDWAYRKFVVSPAGRFAGKAVQIAEKYKPTRAILNGIKSADEWRKNTDNRSNKEIFASAYTAAKNKFEPTVELKNNEYIRKPSSTLNRLQTQLIDLETRKNVAASKNQSTESFDTEIKKIGKEIGRLKITEDAEVKQYATKLAVDSATPNSTQKDEDQLIKAAEKIHKTAITHTEKIASIKKRDDITDKEKQMEIGKVDTIAGENFSAAMNSITNRSNQKSYEQNILNPKSRFLETMYGDDFARVARGQSSQTPPSTSTPPPASTPPSAPLELMPQEAPLELMPQEAPLELMPQEAPLELMPEEGTQEEVNATLRELKKIVENK